MKEFHQALATALLCGAVGFAVPGYAATPGDPSSSTSTAAEQSSTNATDTKDTKIPAKPAKRAVRPRITAEDEEYAIIEALNQKSLEGVQSGQTPDFAAVEPASHQQAQAAHATNKSVIRHRTNTKPSAKKGA
jgi:hypothetical protein